MSRRRVTIPLALALTVATAGAQELHWAFVPPVRPAVPTVAGAAHPIDAFVRQHLGELGLDPAAEAERTTLIRRLSLDLRGLPPTLAEVDAFLADTAPEAYERLVDSLLASPHFGERMVLPWLDASRYADSNGYQNDGDRQNWPWRDWLVRGFNDNRPFDELAVEMLAGDLLSDATVDQRVATAFNRNHPVNDEGGAIADEVRFNYVVDRVHTTATTFLGLTFACAQCHDHKYDPISQREYYAFFALFDNVDEDGRIDIRRRHRYHQFAAERPVVELATPEQQAELDAANRLVDAAQKAGDDATRRTADALVRELHERLPVVMVMGERAERRPTRIHARGAYDAPIGDVVAPAIPAALGPLRGGVPADRLAFARWLVAPDNPLFARVMVDRIWRTILGRGLVPTPEDFGLAGRAPTHPALLDWLATEFIESGFDQKALVRLIVTSATYRQSAHVTPATLERDPTNTWFARSPRDRLSSFVLRDAALSVAGLLDVTVGGPPVYPPHPTGLWRDVSFDVFGYPPPRDGDGHRRSLYTFWRRTVAPPAMFDAANRQACVVSHPPTNTPLHALVTLNDPGFAECARALAARVAAVAADDDARITLMFRLATARSPRDAERIGLCRALARQRNLGTEVAAWIALAQLVLNLDEVLTRP